MMKQYSDDELEQLFKEVVHEIVESAPPPPLEESWVRFEKKLKERQALREKPRKTERKKILSLRFAVVAGIIIFLVATFSISFPVKAKALGEKIVNRVETLLSGTQANIRTEYKHNEPGQTPQPPEDFREVPTNQERIVSLEEAKSSSPFPVSIPQYIPVDYELAQVKFQEMLKNTASITLKYTASNSSLFLISEANTPDGYVQGYGYDKDDAIVQDIKIGEYNGKIVIFKNEDIKITWIKQGILYNLEGKIQKEDALKVAESIR